MPAASLETTLELWSTTLRQAQHRMRPLFAAPSVAASANAFLDGLLGAERRKTGWMRAEAAGDPGPWRQQAILGRSHWNSPGSSGRRNTLREEVAMAIRKRRSDRSGRGALPSPGRPSVARREDHRHFWAA